MLTLAVLGLALAVGEANGCAVPDWLFPSNTPSAQAAPRAADEVLGLPGSTQTFTRAQLGDLDSAPDWHPNSHAPPPDIVVHGRAPEAHACGYCHGPTGQGRPENASLAGQSAAYLAAQVRAFAKGSRRGAACDPYRPSDLMIQTAQGVDEADIEAAADYFSRATPRSRVRVVEADRVPRSRVTGLVYAAEPGGGEEPLGVRLLEFSPDPERHELRDDRLQYLAYVPRGSIARGRRLAAQDAAGPSTACQSCHGARLGGVGDVPALAGRSPSYLLRSLFAFKTGRRSGGTADLMRPMAASLDTAAMIDVVAYAASLPVGAR